MIGKIRNKNKSLEVINKIDFYGVDISVNYLNIAEEKGINVSLSMLEKLTFQKNIFDLIIYTDVLEHVLDSNISVNNLRNCLKKGGIFDY